MADPEINATETEATDSATQDDAAERAIELQKLNDRLLRALADAENSRRRADNSRQEGFAAGVADVTKSLIPALDSLDLAIETVRKQDSAERSVGSILEGLDGTRRAFVHALERFGVVLICPDQGERFDPNLHEAVAARDETDVASGAVSEVVQSGFRMGPRLLRPARVIIAT